MNEENRFDSSDLVAALNRHDVTDEDGNLVPEETPASEVTTEETPVESPKQEEETSEIVEDETTGKKFVPQKRFDEVYAKMKDLERKLETPKVQPAREVPSTSSVPVDRAMALEMEFLHSTMPEFDPNSDKYNQKLDLLGAQFYKANPGITLIAAARKAKEFVRDIATSQEAIRNENRNIKAIQSEGSIVKRSSATTVDLDPGKMSLKDKEEWLKANGMW